MLPLQKVGSFKSKQHLHYNHHYNLFDDDDHNISKTFQSINYATIPSMSPTNTAVSMMTTRQQSPSSSSSSSSSISVSHHKLPARGFLWLLSAIILAIGQILSIHHYLIPPGYTTLDTYNDIDLHKTWLPPEMIRYLREDNPSPSVLSITKQQQQQQNPSHHLQQRKNLMVHSMVIHFTDNDITSLISHHPRQNQYILNYIVSVKIGIHPSKKVMKLET